MAPVSSCSLSPSLLSSSPLSSCSCSCPVCYAYCPASLSPLPVLSSSGRITCLRNHSMLSHSGRGSPASKASTCWEGWDNETSPAYAKEGGHYHGSHNHAWLCGGVG